MPSDTTSISERVVELVANVTERDPTVLPRLYDSVDPDALDSLVASMAEGGVRFTYAGKVVCIDSDGEIELADSPAAAESSDSKVSTAD